MRGVLKITKQTRIFPVTLMRKTAEKMVYSVNCSHVKLDEVPFGSEFPVSVKLAISRKRETKATHDALKIQKR